MKFKFTEWTTEEKNNLPDSSFAYIEEGGTKDSDGKTTPRSKRHLPYKNASGEPDLPHVRNALARLDQTQIPEEAKPEIKKKLEAILAKAKASDTHLLISPFEFDEGAGVPSMIHIIPVGVWDHDLYGKIEINASDIDQFVRNFNAGIRKGIFITAGHEGMSELPAVGWIIQVEAREDGLWGSVDWNEYGQKTLSDKQFKFFSPEFYPVYEDPETHQKYSNVLTGGALTKSPYFKELQAIIFSETKQKFNNTMNINDILKKKKADLTSEEKAFLKKNKDEMSDKQKEDYADMIKDEDGEEEKKKKAKKEADDKAALDEAARIKAAEGSGKVEIKASELEALRVMADKGAQAFKELEMKALSETVLSLTFSDKNKAGRFLPKSSDSLKAFIEKLSPELRKSFSDLVAQLPKFGESDMFKEVGEAKGGTGSALAEVEVKIAAKMKADDKLSYSKALKEVMAESEAKGENLEMRFDEELAPARR